MLNDYEIRRSLIENLHKKNEGKHYRVIEELVICDGLARADVTVANGVLHGYEIKSDYDTFKRLPNQVKCYDTTFDKVTIVIGNKFIEKVQGYIPEYWGIDVAYLNRFGNVTIKHIRPCKSNKKISAESLLDLVWSNEIKQLFRSKKIHGYSGKTKNGLKKMAIENLSLRELKKFTRETLKIRSGWREDLV